MLCKEWDDILAKLLLNNTHELAHDHLVSRSRVLLCHHVVQNHLDGSNLVTFQKFFEDCALIDTKGCVKGFIKELCIFKLFGSVFI